MDAGRSIISDVFLSHPSRVCGLKLRTFSKVPRDAKVAPFAGVWIEIMYEYILTGFSKRRTLRGCVD